MTHNPRDVHGCTIKASPPSLNDIARNSGVHQSTVSRVLKDDPRISKATADKVHKAAKALGYVPDPYLVKLMTHMRGMRETRFESVIGFMMPDEPYPDPFSRALFKGALTRTKELGYVADCFPVDMSPDSIRSLNRVLRARGIDGLLLLPRVVNTAPPSLNIEQLSIVRVTSYTEHFPVHEVLPDHAHNMDLVRVALEKRRAQKPGLISWDDLDRRQHHAGPRMLYQYYVETLHKLPTPTFVWEGTDSDIEKRFQQWFTKHRPDALILPNPSIHKAVEKNLRKMKLPLPPCYATSHHSARLPGVDQQPHEIGRAAIDMLTAHMQRNEKGWPQVAKHMLIPGRWVKI